MKVIVSEELQWNQTHEEPFDTVLSWMFHCLWKGKIESLPFNFEKINIQN